MRILAAVHLVLNVPDERFDELAVKCEEVCVGFLSHQGAVVTLTEFLELTARDDFIDQAKALVERVEHELGVDVLGFDYDLVNTTEIAHRTGRSRQNVHQYIEGSLGPGGFPPPFGLAGGVRVWDWARVHQWLRRHGLTTESSVHPPLYYLEQLNGWAHERAGQQNSLPEATSAGTCASRDLTAHEPLTHRIGGEVR
ncbi:hypothetical protein AB0I30_23200 [Nocardia tengchongensis]|uniref:hypothetical protein n=1 Tax=Nocardia tengchongensis TaxID=2055889 RepID=UPI0033F21DEE